MACPVCFGGEDPIVRDGLMASVSSLSSGVWEALICMDIGNHYPGGKYICTYSIVSDRHIALSVAQNTLAIVRIRNWKIKPNNAPKGR